MEKNWKRLDHRYIYDELGNIIGKIRFPSPKEISVLEPNEEEIFIVEKKGMFRPSYEMRNNKRKTELIFKIKKFGKLDKRKISMESLIGNEFLEARIGAYWSLEIKDRKKNQVATFTKLSQAFMPTNLNLNFENAYGFETIDPLYNKKFLVSFFVVILDAISEKFFIDHVEKYADG